MSNLDYEAKGNLGCLVLVVIVCIMLAATACSRRVFVQDSQIVVNAGRIRIVPTGPAVIMPDTVIKNVQLIKRQK